MKRILLIVIIFLEGYISFAQDWIYSTRISCTENLYELISIIDDNGNTISFGMFSGVLTAPNGEFINSNGYLDYFVIKFLSSGDFAWMNNFGSKEMDYPAGGVDVDIEGNIYLTGGFQDYLKYSTTDSVQSTGSYDIFLTKLSNNGNIEWLKNIGSGATAQFSNSLEISKTGDILIAGGFSDSITINDSQTLYNNNDINNAFYGAFNSSNGDLVWIKEVKTLYNGPLAFWDIATTNDGYYIAGNYKDSIVFENDTITSDKSQSNVILFKTDLTGNLLWKRRIHGNNSDFCYNVLSDSIEENLYVAGYFNSDTILFDSSDSQFIEDYSNSTYNIFLAKYKSSGDLEWHRIIGGKGDDRVFGLEYFNNRVYLSGRFADTIFWGGIKLTTKGRTDLDMFTGAFDPEGNYREANKFSGRNNSKEESRGVFQNGDKLYTVMISNSDLLVVGDSIYTSDGLTDYMILGVIGCLPISIDNVIVNDVNTCYGDSTGSLQILATGGFGSPYQYSIDNGLSYQPTISYFGNLPAGEYPVVVIDQKNCAQDGPSVTIGQPDTLRIEVVSTADITNEADGSIVVAATGGTTPYTFTLLPDNLIQGFGTYTFQPGDSGRYVVQVNDAKNCGPVETDSIDILDFYGVGFEDISELEVRMFPNPATNMITLEMPLDEAEVTLEIMSLTGQVLISHQVYPSGGVLRENIDVSDLSRGMYMVRVNGKTLRSGIIVN